MTTSSHGGGSGERPDCFGEEARVCPRDEDGFLQPQSGCVACAWVPSCLRTALERSGQLPNAAKTPAGVPGEAAEPGMVRFLKRWSERKRSVQHGDRSA